MDSLLRRAVDGQPVGTADGIRERFTWEPEKALIRLGVNYAGLLDDPAIYDRPLTGAEVQQLHSGKAPLAEKT